MTPAAGAPVRVELWTVDLAAVDPAGAHVLDADETARAARFLAPDAARRFVARRVALRTVLGVHLGLDPAQVVVDRGGFGRPSLPAAPDLHLSTSHSGDLALVALGPVRLGVDLESGDTRADLLDVASALFAPEELAAIRALPGPSRIPACLAAWTRKEAFVKADGRGLRLPLTGFAVTVGPGTPPRLLRALPGDHRHWSVSDVSDRTPGCVAALVTETPGRPAVRHRDLSDLTHTHRRRDDPR